MVSTQNADAPNMQMHIQAVSITPVIAWPTSNALDSSASNPSLTIPEVATAGIVRQMGRIWRMTMSREGAFTQTESDAVDARRYAEHTTPAGTSSMTIQSATLPHSSGFIYTPQKQTLLSMK